MWPDTTELSDIADVVEDVADQQRATLGTLIDSVGHVGLTAVLIVPALILASPLSGIPGLSSVMGIIISLVSVQLVMGRDQIWMPQWILRREFNGERFTAAFKKIRPFIKWLDSRAHSRWTFLTRRPVSIIPQLLCVVSGAVVPILEFVPFTSSLVGFAVTLLALGMLAKDGLILALGVLPYVGIAWLFSSIL